MWLEGPGTLKFVLALLSLLEGRVVVTEFANKYEQEAHTLVQGLAGTKWDDGFNSKEPVRTKSAVESLVSFTRQNPWRSLIITAAVAFVCGSQRSAIRR